MYDVRNVLTIVRSEADDESVTVDLCQRSVSVRTSRWNAKSLSRTNEMIREDLYRSKARCVYEMAPHCEGHDRESGRGSGVPARFHWGSVSVQGRM